MDSMSHTLTKVPLENGAGEPLKVCPSCEGCGRFATAHIAKKNPKTGEMWVDQRQIRPSDAARYERDGARVERGFCDTCGGAGMVKKKGKK